MSEINVVPYIDVMLVLLVIFMITATQLQLGMEVDLPDVETTPYESGPREPVVVTVTAKGDVVLEIGTGAGKPVSPKRLVAIITAVLTNKPGTAVLVNGDEHVDYGTVARVMGLLRQAGVSTVGLMAEPPVEP